MSLYNNNRLRARYNVGGEGKRQDMRLYIWHDHSSVTQKLFMQKLEGNTKNADNDCLWVVGLWVVHSCYLFSKLFIKNTNYSYDQNF